MMWQFGGAAGSNRQAEPSTRKELFHHFSKTIENYYKLTSFDLRTSGHVMGEVQMR